MHRKVFEHVQVSPLEFHGKIFEGEDCPDADRIPCPKEGCAGTATVIWDGLAPDNFIGSGFTRNEAIQDNDVEVEDYA